MNYQKELNYLNNMERQFRIIGVALNQAKKEGKKTITLKNYGIQNTKNRCRVESNQIPK